MNNKKILLLGKVCGAYRAQNLIKTILDQGYNVSYSSFQYYRGVNNVKLFDILMMPFFVICTLIKSLWADCILVLPMNHKYFLMAYLSKVLFGRKIITDMYISLYDTGLDRGWYRDENSIKAKYHKFIDKMMIEHSDALISLSQFELDYVVELVGAQTNKVSLYTIPLCVDIKPIAFPSSSSLFRVCWWGTFIPLHGLEKIIEAINILKQQKMAIQLDIFGTPGPLVQYYKDLVIHKELTDCISVTTEKTFSNNQLTVHLQSKCDLALGNFGDSAKAKTVLVNKVVDAFAMGIPVLTMRTLALDELIDSQNELFISEATSEAIAKSIRQIANDRENAKKIARAGHLRYRETFSYDVFKIRVEKVLHDCGL